MKQDTAAMRPYIIKDATIKDDYCNYSYEITDGIGFGDTHNVKGSGVIEDDLRKAMGILNVHLAVIDDVFKHSGIEIEDIDRYHAHDLTGLYNVTGIKIKGSKENESVIIIGNKYVSSAGGRIELASPKIPLDSMSSYKWYNELIVAVEDVRHEVELYKEGKYVQTDDDDDDEPVSNSRQMTIGDAIDETLAKSKV